MKFLSFCSMTFSANLTNCTDKYGSHMTIWASLVLVVRVHVTKASHVHLTLQSSWFPCDYSSFASTLSSVVAEGHWSTCIWLCDCGNIGPGSLTKHQGHNENNHIIYTSKCYKEYELDRESWDLVGCAS